MLVGATVLVLEDEYLIALEIQRILEALGARVIIGAAGLENGLPPPGHATFDLAVISVGPDGVSGLALCAELAARGVGIIVLSSSDEHSGGISGLETAPVVVKPFSDIEIITAAQAVRRRVGACPNAIN